MILLTADLHLDDKPKHDYRFGIFDFLIEQQNRYQPWAVFILGDLTDAKDRHNARLVNRIVDGLVSLTERSCVYVLKGNHDYKDSENPFFKFINNIDKLKFVTKTLLVKGESNCLFIPHVEKWPKLKKYRGKADYVFIHQCVDGAIAETGAKLSGINVGPVAAVGGRQIFAGDIHRPQQVGAVTYVGAPYRVRFGEDYTPRLLVLDDSAGSYEELHMPCPMKHSVTVRTVKDLKRAKLKVRDQVKVTVNIKREDVVDWPHRKREILEACKSLGVEVFSLEAIITDKKAAKNEFKENEGATIKIDNKLNFKQFCKLEGVDKETRLVGEYLMEP